MKSDAVTPAQLIAAFEKAKRILKSGEEGFICFALKDHVRDKRVAEAAIEIVEKAIHPASTFISWAVVNRVPDSNSYAANTKSGTAIRIRWINKAIRTIRKW